MAGRYAQQRLYVGGDSGSLLLHEGGTDADPQPASEEYDGVFEDLTGNRANDHKVNELRFSNNFVEKRSSSFLKALRNQGFLFLTILRISLKTLKLQNEFFTHLRNLNTTFL